MAVITVTVPTIEDEIERAWQAHLAAWYLDDATKPGKGSFEHTMFEIGFRAARTFPQVSLT